MRAFNVRREDRILANVVEETSGPLAAGSRHRRDGPPQSNAPSTRSRTVPNSRGAFNRHARWPLRRSSVDDDLLAFRPPYGCTPRQIESFRDAGGSYRVSVL